MRLPPAVVPAVALLLAIAAGASARPRDAELGRLAADGPVTLASNKPGVALLQADGFKPGSSVSGTVSLTNKGDRPGVLELGATGLQDRPGVNGGRLSSALRLRVEDLNGAMVPLESRLDQASTFALGSLRGGETRSYRVTASFPDGGLPPGPAAGDNLQQGSSVQVALQWQLTAAAPAVPTPVPTPVATPAPAVAPPATTLPTLPSDPLGRAVLVRLRIPAQRVIGPRGLKVYARCEVACRLRFTAKIDSAPRGHVARHTLLAKRVLRKQRHARRIRAGREQRVFLRLTHRGLKRLKRQLHRRGRAGITVVAHMRSKAGNRTARRRIVMRTYKRGERRATR
ncbi:MAG: hypothetical protein QOE53_3280 [Pseudonocardiales bacterium]|nr:hypothetical protein [Pseudonocardiales bacterium]